MLVCEASWLPSVRSVQCRPACMCACVCSCVLQLDVHEHVWGRERKGGHFCVWVPSARQSLCTWLVVDRKLGLCVRTPGCMCSGGGRRQVRGRPAGGSICPPKLLGPFTEALEEGTREAISRPPTTPTSGHLDDPCLRPPGSRGPHPPRAAICLGLEIWGGSSRSGGWPVMGSLSFLTPNAHLRGRQKCAGRILALGRNLVNGKEDWIDRRARAPSLNGQVVTEPSPGSASLQSEEHTLLGCRAIGAHISNAAGVD